MQKPQLDIWKARLNHHGWPPEAQLPDSELVRARKMRHEHVRDNWTASRWALRTVLAHYLGEQLTEIALAADEHGKPRLADPDASLRFNLSHSGDLALVAVAWGREVGVDVERVVLRKDLLALAGQGLAPEEATRIEVLAPEEQLPAFYASWTRREAVAKCHGIGLGAPLPEAKVAVSNFDPSDPGYAAAVAVAGEELPPLQHFELSGEDPIPLRPSPGP